MAVRIRVAPLLYSYTGGLKTIEVDGSTLRAAIALLDRRYPGVAFRMIDEQGKIRPHMNIFVGEQSVRDLDVALADGVEIYIVGALSGG
ncbi:MAG TPA: MoaD/ThiS family protein [Terriglobia bacterium]|nr:MoaD/ThiS family protein [Terriglobia bacterium]